MWIESHQELGRHPKTRRLARALRISVPTAIGHLHLLWWWALDFAPDGGLAGFHAAELAEAALWTDTPRRFLAALVAAGFVDGDGTPADPYRLHDWEQYGGKLLDRRQRNAERQRVWRDRQRPGPESMADGHVTVTQRFDDGHVTVTRRLRNGATVPNLLTTGVNRDERARARTRGDAPCMEYIKRQEARKAAQRAATTSTTRRATI